MTNLSPSSSVASSGLKEFSRNHHLFFSSWSWQSGGSVLFIFYFAEGQTSHDGKGQLKYYFCYYSWFQWETLVIEKHSSWNNTKGLQKLYFILQDVCSLCWLEEEKHHYQDWSFGLTGHHVPSLHRSLPAKGKHMSKHIIWTTSVIGKHHATTQYWMHLMYVWGRLIINLDCIHLKIRKTDKTRDKIL